MTDPVFKLYHYHNVRDLDTADQMGWLAKRMAGKRLSYRELIA